MKTKKINHPRIYLEILNKEGPFIKIKYKDNKFNEDGKRVASVERIDLKEISDKFSNDFNEILDKLNDIELVKINNYIKTQYKVLKYHIKKNHYDSVSTVKESIKVMENFKEELISL
tara:strand:+ start:112 stop:462 length:351 start_codon:yes stop_codon:yes gene_type:complete